MKIDLVNNLKNVIHNILTDVFRVLHTKRKEVLLWELNLPTSTLDAPFTIVKTTAAVTIIARSIKSR